MTAYQERVTARCPAVRKRQVGRTLSDLQAANHLLAKRRSSNRNRSGRNADSYSDLASHPNWLGNIKQRLTQQLTFTAQEDEPLLSSETKGCDDKQISAELQPQNPLHSDKTTLRETLFSAENVTIKAHPDILLALLRQQAEAAGRIWLLCRYIDKSGSGRLDLQELMHYLTHRSSPFRICGKRRLRQLLTAGEGRFWRREKTQRGVRVWLMGVAQLANALGLQQLKGKPIALPLDALCEGIGRMRAACYATVYANRENDQPISRASLCEQTGIPERTQRRYDGLLNVERTLNIAINGQVRDLAESETHHWQHGPAAFEFVDYRGKVGKQGRRYRARRLPNSYQCPFQPAPHGRWRKVRRQLQDLVAVGARGNGERQAAKRIYHRDGRQLANGYNKPTRTCYLRISTVERAVVWTMVAPSAV